MPFKVVHLEQYFLICDDCGRLSEPGVSKGDALEQAITDGWHKLETASGRTWCTCPECWEHIGEDA